MCAEAAFFGFWQATEICTLCKESRSSVNLLSGYRGLLSWQ